MTSQDTKVYRCAYCGNSCDDKILAIRHIKTTYITNGIAEVGEAKQPFLYFCDEQHRHIYFVGL